MDFYRAIHQYYEDIFPLNPQQPAWIKRLELPSGASLLDIGCATGQLAFALADEGYRVEAFDLDQAMIESALDKVNGNNPGFRTGNMIDLDELYQGYQFDLALCFGNTLVHLPGEKSMLNFFEAVFRKLKPGGRFLGQILNYNLIIGEQRIHLPLIDTDLLTFVREYAYPGNDTIRFITRLILKREGKILENEISLYPLMKSDLEKLLGLAGFSKLRFYSSFSGDAYQKTALPFIFEAQR